MPRVSSTPPPPPPPQPPTAPQATITKVQISDEISEKPITALEGN